MELSVTDGTARAAELIGQWNYPAARTVLAEAVARAEATGRWDHLDGLTARRMLAEVLRELGDPAGGYQLVAPALDTCRDRYGDGHPGTVRTLAVLATVLHDLGELDAARDCYERVVASGAAANGPAGRAVLLARANLALLARDEGDGRTAVRELTAAYTLHRRAFGGGDLETIRLAAELGRLHSSLGDRTNARHLLTLAHGRARGELGEEHPLTAVVEAALSEVEPPMPSAVEERPKSPAHRRSWRRPATRPRVRRRSWLRGRSWRWTAALPRLRRRWWPSPAAHPRVRRRWWPRRRWLRRPAVPPRVLVGTALSAGALLAVAGAAVAVASRPAHRAAPPVVRTTAGPSPSPSRTDGPRAAPRDVVLSDDGTSVTVSWSDPSGGTGSVLLAVARAGQPAGPLQSLPPGTVRHRVTGLDPRADYCVVLAVVYGQDTVAQAAQVCTHRHIDSG